MRIYLPATLPMLRRAVQTGSFVPQSGIGFAVTHGLEQEYAGADTEDLEYVAMHDAALASLRLIAAQQAEPVRVVLAVDFATERAGSVAPRGPAAGDAEHGAGVARAPIERGDLDRAVVILPGQVDWATIASVHLDGGDVAGVIRAAADAVAAADLGDLDAAVTVGDAEDVDLGWYAPNEIGYLVTELGQV